MWVKRREQVDSTDKVNGTSFIYLFINAFLSRDDDNRRKSQLIQIYSVDWTNVYNTHKTLNTEQNQLAIKISADNKYYRNASG